MKTVVSLALLLSLNAVLGTLLYCASPQSAAAPKRRPAVRGRVLLVEHSVGLAG